MDNMDSAPLTHAGPFAAEAENGIHFGGESDNFVSRSQNSRI